jgi:hypothetical protein
MQEAKLFEFGSLVVTSERFVHGSDVLPIEDIKFALPSVDKGWLGTATIAAIGLAMLIWGGVGAKLFGLLVCAGAYGFFRGTLDRRLLVSLNSGDLVTIKVDKSVPLTELAQAIATAIEARHRERATALREDLDSLPTSD